MLLRPQPRSSAPRRATSAGEEGYMLLAVVVMAALMLIALSVAAPMISRDIRRDKEVESERRSEQYVRAVRLYYRKFNGPPPSMEALEKSNNIRFLRKQYVDPLTGQSDWRVIHLGEQKTKIKVFGEELSGLGTSMGAAASSSTSTIGSTPALSAGFGGASITTTGSSTSLGAGTTAGGASGTGGTTGSNSSSSGSSSSSGKIGPIVGVGTARSGDSILNPNGQTTYDTEEFWYDPRIEQYYKRSQILGGGGLQVGGGGLGSGGINSKSASSFGQDAVSGQSNSSSGSNSLGSGSTSTKPQ